MDPLLEQRRIDALTARTSALGGFQPQGGVPDPGPAQAAEGPCFQVNRLTVEGATLLTRTELDALTAPFAPKCMQGADIQGAMRAIDAAYANKGYITTKTYIPPQNLGSGTLTLKVVEGHVEGIYLIDGNGQIEGARARRLLGTAFPLQKGRLFNLRDFEQGLDQMNRLTSVDATLRLQPGQMTGGSDILVQRMQEDRFRGALRFDTLGSRMNGRNRLALDLGLDDLLGMNDTWVLNLSSTRNTNALSLYGSVPWRYWTFEIEFGHSEYLTPLSPLSELFGSTRSAVITARYMLARGQYSTTEASFALNQRHSQRFINDSRLTPQRLASLDLGVSHIRLGQSARNSVDATVSFGLDALGADRDPAGLGRDDPRAQYVLISGGWQRQAGLRDMGTLVTDLRLQLSHQALYGSEQLALGSYATVRGYDEPVAAGDRGAYLRTDLYLSPDFWTQIVPEQIRAEVTTRMQPLLFLDVGFAHDVASSRTTRAAGIGVGVSWQFDRVTASGLVGLPLIDSRNRVHSDDPVMQIRFDVKTW
ncbi:ShlB/FhaC/HecB family hemolysin secretion/activation protein [Paenirhodobacter populi]|nr:ShlB/FhaC/HecB family hemolysin secretion/activation protein [Sinirhodobacter populi]